MTSSRLVPAGLALVSCIGFSSMGCKGAPVEELHSKALKRTTSMKSYRVTLESEIYPAPVPIEEASDGGVADAPVSPFQSSGGHATKRSTPQLGMKATLYATLKAEGVLPDRLRVEATGQSGSLARTLDALYDGATVMTAMKSGDEPRQVASVEQKKLALEGKPFDVGFTLRGFGLFDGEDYQGTVLRLLKSWSYDEAAKTTFANRECFELRGRIDVDKATDDILGPRGARAGRVVAQPTNLDQAKLRTAEIEKAGMAIAKEIRSMTYASLFVTEEGDVIGWRLGGRTGRLLEARVTSFERDAAIDPARFAIPDSSRAIARDITPLVAQQRSSPLPTMQELRTFKDQIRAEAMRGPALTSSTPPPAPPPPPP